MLFHFEIKITKITIFSNKITVFDSTTLIHANNASQKPSVWEGRCLGATFPRGGEYATFAFIILRQQFTGAFKDAAICPSCRMPLAQCAI